MECSIVASSTDLHVHLFSVFNIYWYFSVLCTYFKVASFFYTQYMRMEWGKHGTVLPTPTSTHPPQTIWKQRLASKPHPTYQKPSYVSAWGHLSRKKFIPTKSSRAESHKDGFGQSRVVQGCVVKDRLSRA